MLDKNPNDGGDIVTEMTGDVRRTAERTIPLDFFRGRQSLFSSLPRLQVDVECGGASAECALFPLLASANFLPIKGDFSGEENHVLHLHRVRNAL